MEIKVNIPKQSGLFRDYNYTIEDIVAYIQKTNISPAPNVGLCKWLIPAYKEAKRTDIKAAHGYIKQGCYYCMGQMPKHFCNKYRPIK